MIENRLKDMVRESVKKVLTEDVNNFNNVIDKTSNKLNESSVNRMLQWLKNRDCAFITAFRNELRDIRDEKSTYLGPEGKWKAGKAFTHEENRQKNKLLVAELVQLGYGVTKVKGVYPEGMADETSEESFLVVNRNDDKNFLPNLLRIAEFYNQDSIYYKKKGETTGTLIGTNDSGWPEYHKTGEESTLKTNTASNYMSRLGNKAFSFIGQDSEKTKGRKEAMDSISKSQGTDDEWKQRYWTDNDKNTFTSRKEQRKQRLTEAVSFWRKLTDGKMLVKENIHPLTRKTMGEGLRKIRK
jgi:uncharacterized protein YggL (DUF469 family)